jgi:hypothetical protein
MTDHRFEQIYHAARESWLSTHDHADRQLRQALDLISVEGSDDQVRTARARTRSGLATVTDGANARPIRKRLCGDVHNLIFPTMRGERFPVEAHNLDAARFNSGSRHTQKSYPRPETLLAQWPC